MVAAIWTGHARGTMADASPRPPAVDDTVAPTLAGLGRRLTAVVVDVVVYYLYLAAVVVAPWWVGVRVLGPSAGEVVGGLVALVGVLAYVAWFFLGLGRLGQTYGKHLLALEVIDRDTQRPIGGGLAVARQVINAIGLYTLGLGWLWATWDRYRQGWHDKTVNSVVVRTHRRRVGPVTHARAAFRGRW